jgi:hypothetical protein
MPTGSDISGGLWATSGSSSASSSEFGRQQGYGRSEIIQMINDLPQDA